MIQIDIPMPENCAGCPCYGLNEFEDSRCNITGNGFHHNIFDGRAEDCPLKEQEIRELTMDEWREWKNNPKRNPICELWEHDTSPIWVLNPDTIHEPALLMGKLKLFTGKPTFEQCKEVKWDDK